MAIKNQDKNADNAALFFLGPSLFFMAAVPKNNADNTDKSVAIEKRFFIKRYSSNLSLLYQRRKEYRCERRCDYKQR